MNRIRLNLIFILIGVSFLACSNKEEPTSFDRKPILVNLSDTLIIPSYEAVIQKSNNFELALSKFNDSPVLTDLVSLQQAWLELALSWKTAEAFNFGPIEDLLITSSIDYIPADTSGIIKAITDYNDQPNYLLSQGSNKKGIAAMEYVVYGKSKNLLAGEGNYISYLSLLNNDIKVKIQKVLEAWTGDYHQGFISNTGDAAGSGLTLVSNQMIFLAEKVKNIKLGIPMAKTGVITPSPQKLEAPYSKKSLQLLKQNIEGLKEVFNGGNGNGFDDYIKALNIKDAAGILLSEKINDQFDAVIVEANKVDANLFQAIENKDPQLDKLYLELINLTIILKNDMMSQLGLLTVFSDNDGD